MFYDLIVFLPLLGFLIAGLLGQQIGARNSELVTTGLLGFCALLSWIAFFTVALGSQDKPEFVHVGN
jgi:NADH-quinone oxidoreductase subunit L